MLISFLLPEQFDYALRKKGVDKMIVLVSVPTSIFISKNASVNCS